MRKLMFEWTNVEQNSEINKVFNKINNHFQNGRITLKEADYMFIIQLQGLECLNSSQVGEVFQNVNFKLQLK